MTKRWLVYGVMDRRRTVSFTGFWLYVVEVFPGYCRIAWTFRFSDGFHWRENVPTANPQESPFVVRGRRWTGRCSTFLFGSVEGALQTRNGHLFGHSYAVWFHAFYPRFSYLLWLCLLYYVMSLLLFCACIIYLFILCYYFRLKCKRCINGIETVDPPEDADCTSDLAVWHHSQRDARKVRTTVSPQRSSSDFQLSLPDCGSRSAFGVQLRCNFVRVPSKIAQSRSSEEEDRRRWGLQAFRWRGRRWIMKSFQMMTNRLPCLL